MEEKNGPCYIQKNLTLKILDWYIIKKFLGTFFFSISLILAISIVWDITEKLEDFIQKKAPISAIVFDYYLNFIPYFAAMLAPLFIFIAVIYFTARMAANTEIVAILSGGVSFMRLLRPYFIAAAFLASITYYAGSWLVPNSNKIRLDFEYTYIFNQFVYSGRNFHRQIAPGEFIYMETFNNLKNSGLRFSLERIESGKVNYKLSSETIRWDSTGKKWILENYVARSLMDSAETIRSGKKMDTAMAFLPSEFSRRLESVEMMDDRELDAFIRSEKAKGSDNLDFYMVEKYSRIASPFSTFILTLIGVSLASRKVRGGIGLQIVFGLFLSFTYIFFMQLSNTFAFYGGLHPLIACWIPNLIFLVVALVLLRLAPK